MLLRILFLATAALVSAFLFAIPPGSPEQIVERIKASGQLCRAGDPCVTAGTVFSASAMPRGGMEVYQGFCFACHTTGASNSPILGDMAAWAPRIEKGMDVLYESTFNGINLMPARGTCNNCTDDELRAAVDYMLDQVR